VTKELRNLVVEDVPSAVRAAPASAPALPRRITLPEHASASRAVAADSSAESALASRGGRLRSRLSAVSAWLVAGRLGPDGSTAVGRHTGARC
jgi:hypothetical protein